MWDRMDSLLKAKKQLNNTSIYKSAEFKENILTYLVESINKMFLSLKTKGLFTQEKWGSHYMLCFIACYKIVLWHALKL